MITDNVFMTSTAANESCIDASLPKPTVALTLADGSTKISCSSTPDWPSAFAILTSSDRRPAAPALARHG